MLTILLSLGFVMMGPVTGFHGSGSELIAQTGKKDKQRKSSGSRKEKGQVDFLFIEANTQYLQNEAEEAIALFKEVLDIDKNHHASMYMIGKLSWELGDYSNSVKYAKMAIELEKNNYWYYFQLSQGYQGLRDIDRAIQVQEQTVKRFPDNKDALFDLAQLYISIADYQKSVEVYDQLEKLTGMNEDVIYRKHRLRLYLNQPDKALEELDKLIAFFPIESRYLQAKYDVLVRNGREEEAIAVLEDILESKPNDGFALLSLADYYQIAGNREKSEAFLLRAFENPDVDLEAKIRILSSMYSFAVRDPEVLTHLRTLGDILYKVHPKSPLIDGIRGDIFQVSDNKDSARYFYRKSLEGNPANESVWQELLILDSELSDFEGMTKDAEQALEYFPNQVIFLYYFGVGSLRQGDRDGAIYAFEKIKKVGVSKFELLLQACVLLGEIYYKEEEYEKSDRNFEEALKLDGDNPLTLNNYAYFLSLRNEQLDRAEEMVKKALLSFPNSPAYLDTYGWILYLKGDYEAAETQLAKAVEQGGTGEVLEHYGDVWLKLGDETKARSFWQKAKETGSENLDIEGKLRKAKIDADK